MACPYDLDITHLQVCPSSVMKVLRCCSCNHGAKRGTTWSELAVQTKLPPAKASEAAPHEDTAGRDRTRLSSASSALTAEAGAGPAMEVSAPAQASATDGDGDWVGGAADDEADDEGTLEEEEVRQHLSESCYAQGCHPDLLVRLCTSRALLFAG